MVTQHHRHPNSPFDITQHWAPQTRTPQLEKLWGKRGVHRAMWVLSVLGSTDCPGCSITEVFRIEPLDPLSKKGVSSCMMDWRVSRSSLDVALLDPIP